VFAPAIDTHMLHQLLTAYMDGCSLTHDAEESCTRLSPLAKQALDKLPHAGWPVIDANGRLSEWNRAMPGMQVTFFGVFFLACLLGFVCGPSVSLGVTNFFFFPLQSYTDIDPGHRHFSSLVSLHPSDLISR